MKDEEIEAPINAEENTRAEVLSGEVTEESSSENNLEETDNGLKVKELSEQEAQILDLANQIGKDGEVESGLIKQEDELKENGKNSEEIEKNINDFDANLMGEAKGNNNISQENVVQEDGAVLGDIIQKEEAHMDIPVSEKIIDTPDTPPTPQISEENQYEAGERPTLKDFLEEQYKKKFMFLEKNNISQAPEESSETSEVSDSSVVLEQQEERVEPENNVVLEQQKEEIQKQKEDNIPPAPENLESTEAFNSDVVLEQQEEVPVSENNEIKQEEDIQVENTYVPQEQEPEEILPESFEVSDSNVVLEQQKEERVEELESNDLLKEEGVQNQSSVPIQAPDLVPKNDDDELYSIKNFSL